MAEHSVESLRIDRKVAFSTGCVASQTQHRTRKIQETANNAASAQSSDVIENIQGPAKKSRFDIFVAAEEPVILDALLRQRSLSQDELHETARRLLQERWENMSAEELLLYEDLKLAEFDQDFEGLTDQEDQLFSQSSVESLADSPRQKNNNEEGTWL